MRGRICAPTSSYSPLDLIINGCFVKHCFRPSGPINQRGYVSGSPSTPWNFFIDRWKNASSEPWAYTISDSGVTLPPGASITQKFEYIAPGTVLTFGVKKSDGTILTATGTVQYNPGGAWIGCAIAKGMNVHIEIGTTGGVPNVKILAMDAAVTLEWAALYEGVYTADTLPTYMPRPYAVELASCRRFYVKTGLRVQTSNGKFDQMVDLGPMYSTPQVRVISAADTPGYIGYYQNGIWTNVGVETTLYGNDAVRVTAANNQSGAYGFSIEAWV